MSTPDPKSRTTPGGKEPKPGTIFGLDFPLKNEFAMWPYRSIAQALLRTQHDLSAFVEVNRKLADETRDIIRHEQDLALQLSEKILQQASSASGGGELKPMIPSKELEEIYDSAVAGIRELGKAVADAQVRSIESLRTHARSTIGFPEGGEQRPSQAA